MNKLTVQKIIELLVFIVSIITFIIGNINNELNTMFIGICIVLLNNIAFALLKIKKNIVFLIFNITFFTLLLGRNFVYMLSNEVWYNEFDIDIEKNTLFLLYLSLGSVWVGTKIYSLYKRYISIDAKRYKSKNSVYNKEILYMRKLLLIAFLLTFIPSIIIIVEKIIFVQQNTYVGLHSTFSSKVPFIIQKLSNTNFTFFLLYLSTFPKRKNVLFITIMYYIYLILSIFTGGRGTFVLGTIILVVYYIYRQFEFGEKYINKKTIFVMGILGIVLIIFLGSYNVLRNKKTIENFNPFEQFKQFFIDQGSSVRLISLVQKYKEQLPETNTNYTFGIIINVLLQKDEFIENTNTVETALNGNNLGATLSYLTMEKAFLRGHGLGTQYIAELYTDFSYPGVIIYNIILGFSLMAIININKENYIAFAIGLNIISNLVYLPRQFALGWITYLLSTTVILAVGATFVLSRLVRRRIKHENSLDS